MKNSRFVLQLLTLTTCAGLTLPTICLAQGIEPGTHLATMHHHPYFFEVLVSSVVGWIIGLVKGFDSSKNWLKTYWPRAPLVILFFLDLLVFVVIGGYFGTGIYNPANFLAALAAGLSWPVGLGALTTKA